MRDWDAAPGIDPERVAEGTVVWADPVVDARATYQHVSTDDPLRARAHRLLGALLAGPSWEEALGSLARLRPSALEAVGRALGEVAPT
jgi:hypothetical protein